MKKELTNDEFLGVIQHLETLRGKTYEFNDIIIRNVEKMREESNIIIKTLNSLDEERRKEALKKIIEFDFIPIEENIIVYEKEQKLEATPEQTYCINKFLLNTQNKKDGNN